MTLVRCGGCRTSQTLNMATVAMMVVVMSELFVVAFVVVCPWRCVHGVGSNPRSLECMYLVAQRRPSTASISLQSSPIHLPGRCPRIRPTTGWRTTKGSPTTSKQISVVSEKPHRSLCITPKQSKASIVTRVAIRKGFW